MTKIEITISPRDGGPRYVADLTEFAVGGTDDGRVRGRKAWGGDFTGRPAFARELTAALQLLRPPEKAFVKWMTSIRVFFRFLDFKESLRDCPRTDGCAQVTDAMGVQLRQWLASNSSAYRAIKMTLNSMRSLHGVRPVFWPNRRPDNETPREPPSQEGMRKLYHALRHEGRQVKAMFAEGQRLASFGADPRVNGGWDAVENRAFLTYRLLQDGVPNRAKLALAGAEELLMGDGPSYLAPTMDPRFGRGLSGALRWFVPGRAEMAVFFWLFMMGTGWNPSTACGVDASDPDGWWQPHPQSDKFAVIHAWKGRSDRHQFTISMTRPEWHPYRILEFVMERTAPLRLQVQNRLADARRRFADDPGVLLEREIADLEKLSRSPWLFATRVMGTVSGFVGNNDSFLLELARAVVEKNGLDGDDWRLGGIVAKDARLAWIGHVYVHSGYHQLLTMLAGNHGSLRTTLHYIRSTRYRAYSEQRIREVQDALFSEIAGGRVVDPSRLRLLVENGHITPEQERRLMDYRQRTSLGMGCLNPVSPPPQVDPDHRQGALCRVQRCTGCPHGIVFPESMSPLARRQAELLHLRRSMPMTAWQGSSLADEYESVEQTLAHFDAGLVQAEIAEWTTRFNEGGLTVHGTYPSY